jgi:hypothetical protein
VDRQVVSQDISRETLGAGIPGCIRQLFGKKLATADMGHEPWLNSNTFNME